MSRKMPKKGIKHRHTKLARRILHLGTDRRTDSAVALACAMAQPSPRRDVDRGAVETQQEVYGFLLVADSS